MSDTKPFFQAIQEGNAAAVEALLAADPSLASSINDRGQSAILAAVYSGKTSIRDLLLAHGVQLQLHEAVAAGQLDKVKSLVARRSELARSSSPDGFPLLALASAFGHLDVAQYLFSHGAGVNAAASNGSGYTALTGAVTGGHRDIVAWLLEKGADANHRYGPGYSPLLAAAANGHLEIVKLLLDHGADLLATTDDGQSALRLAESRGHRPVADFLRSRGLSS
jgi:ankyrin repeat protein